MLDAVQAPTFATRALEDADAGRAEEAAFVAVAGYGFGAGLESRFSVSVLLGRKGGREGKEGRGIFAQSTKKGGLDMTRSHCTGTKGTYLSPFLAVRVSRGSFSSVERKQADRVKLH
jgi:hypothetical protein